jgi:hypothetical protein
VGDMIAPENVMLTVPKFAILALPT